MLNVVKKEILISIRLFDHNRDKRAEIHGNNNMEQYHSRNEDGREEGTKEFE